MKRILLSLLLLVGGITTSVAGINTNGYGADAAPATATITVDVPTQVIRAAAGSEHVLALQTVNPSYIGFTCSTSLTAVNRSVHPNNNVNLLTGTSTTSFANIERESGTITVAGGSVVLGEAIGLTLTMGSDEAYSSEFVVTLNCVEDEIQVCRDGQVLTIGLSERKATDTDAPCPVPQIEVCRDGAIVTIFENERLSTDTNPPCPVEQVEVCRDGEVITIPVTDRKSTDRNAW